MKIYFFETNDEDERILSELMPHAGFTTGDFACIKDKLAPENVAQYADADAISVFINSPVSKDIIDQLPKLRFIETRSTGFDHIDAVYAASKNIPVSTVPAYGSRTVAEFTFTLMLGLSRKAFAAYRQVKEGYGYDISQFEGFNLQGKTLGIVGTGRIGQNVAQIAKGFEMKLLAYDAFPNNDAAAKFGFTYAPLEELLAKSDVITLHVPYNKDTHHLINQQNVSRIKKGALLINTARGEVAETGALIKALDQGILAGVGIDVLEGERQLIDEWHLVAGGTELTDQLKNLVQGHALIAHPKVVYTPHIAFFTEEAKREILQTSVNNLAACKSGTPINVVK